MRNAIKNTKGFPSILLQSILDAGLGDHAAEITAEGWASAKTFAYAIHVNPQRGPDPQQFMDSIEAIVSEKYAHGEDIRAKVCHGRSPRQQHGPHATGTTGLHEPRA